MSAYFDHAATTPMVPAAIAAMTEQLAHTGNASSLHQAGRAARQVVEESRERIAAALGARPSEVIFTSGGTESDNLAVKGTLAARRAADPRRTRLVMSAVEHHAVIDPVAHLVETGQARLTEVAPRSDGIVPAAAVEAALAEDPESVALVTLMWANNEVGTIQPVTEVAELAHAHGIPVHSDAVQALGHVPVDFASSGLDLMTVTAHKLGGPVGVGALVARREAAVVPLSHGGGQERQVRSGTLDVAGIAAFAAALDVAVATLDAEAERLVCLRDRLICGALGLGLGLQVSGAWERGDRTRRLPGNVHLRAPDCEGDSLLYLLDAAGIQCSTGSACQAGVPQPSHVLLAMGCTPDQARGSLRMTMGHSTTQDEVDEVLAALPAAVARARRAHEVSA